jgi:haloacetate dehalogenase
MSGSAHDDAPRDVALADIPLFPGFDVRDVDADGVRIHCVIGGEGPPLLLLHGYPQTHAMWHKVAPALAERFTVVCADLRGYGDSSKPPGAPPHETYSKRAMAADMVTVMRALGYPRFRLAGHDRGGRVAHRLCLDHPHAVDQVAMLDISPTRIMFERTDQAFATAYYHWFFLAQAYDLPERLIGADPSYYLAIKMKRWSAGETGFFDARAWAEYERCFRDPATIHASCEDYRAAASIDLAHDRLDLDRRIGCPLLVLWGAKGVVNRLFDPIADWCSVATDVRGSVMPTGHYIAEEAPAQTLAHLLAFFG